MTECRSKLLEQIRIGLEQLEKVKRGEIPSEQGKELIGKLNELKCLANYETQTISKEIID
jgi:hypothetical protein